MLGSAYAASDGDPRTSWTAPQRVTQHRSAANLELRLPKPTEVAALQLTPSAVELPAHPTLVAVDLGDGPQVRRTDDERRRADHRAEAAGDRRREAVDPRLG